MTPIDVALTTYATPKLRAYAGLSAAGLLLTLVLGRPEPLVLASPFLLVLALGLVRTRRPRVQVGLKLDEERAVEGQPVQLGIELAAEGPVEAVEVWLPLPAGVCSDSQPGRVLRLPQGGTRRVSETLSCERWGGYVIGRGLVRVSDACGLLVHEGRLAASLPLRVFPRAEALRSILRPAETQAFAGNEVSRQAGAGIEFADVREFAAGDQVRHINWRVSARGERLFVNQQHPERNTDVILFLDTWAEVADAQASTLDLTLRAAASLAGRYLEHRDRVGLIAFGGTLRWLTPAMGSVQLHRIVEALLDTRIIFSYAWKDIDVIPRRKLPPKALIVAISPLLDERSLNALVDLRRRGFDLAIIEVSPAAFVESGKSEAEQLGHRLWLLERETLRHRYQRLGISVAVWQPGEPLDKALEEVRAFRRYVRHAAA